LHGDLETFEQQLAWYRPVEVDALADRARGGEDGLGVQRSGLRFRDEPVAGSGGKV
jgi:hypothetical protein